MVRKKGIIVLVLLPLLLLGGCNKKETPTVTRTSFMLDTMIIITLYDWKDEQTLNLAMEEISRLEGLLSVEKEGSDLDLLCKAAGQDWVSISPETEEVLRLSKEIWAKSEGHFDVTTGPLIDLWAIRDRKGHYPTEQEQKDAIARVSSEKLLIEDGRAYLSEPGMKANLGAIAKGYIADQVKDVLVKAGVKHAIIDLGRNLVIIGGKPDGSKFQIGVQSPFEEQGKIMKVLAVSDRSVVTAGVNERFFEYEGVRYHHILDPFTGFPADTGVASVTIISESSALGDSLSTTCLLLGEEKGMALIEGMKDIQALFILKDGEMRMSSGLSAYEVPS